MSPRQFLLVRLLAGALALTSLLSAAPPPPQTTAAPTNGAFGVSGGASPRRYTGLPPQRTSPPQPPIINPPG